MEDAIRTAAELTRQDQFLIIGSQAILGTYSENDLPLEATMSREVDIASFRDEGAEEAADIISINAGELSQYDQEHGFYLEGVQKETAILPPNWEYRLVSIRSEATRNATGLCLSPEDLCASKLMAHRAKDLEYVSALLREGLVNPASIRELVEAIDLEAVRSDQTAEELAYRRESSIRFIDNWTQRGSLDGP